MRPFQIIALTPPGFVDPSIAIAASRAGELGILDLEFMNDEKTALSAIDKLAKHARSTCGVKFGRVSNNCFETLTANLTELVKFIILTSRDHQILSRQVDSLHQKKLQVFYEAGSIEEAQTAVDAKVDGLIAKGNEAGGWVGEETAFVLLQRLTNNVSLPIWVQGGIGSHTAAACYVAGAQGVVLDIQLALTRESPIPKETRNRISRMDGSETICLGEEIGAPCRIHFDPALTVVKQLRKLEHDLAKNSPSGDGTADIWRQEVRKWFDHEKILPIGQDVAFAASMAQRFRTVGGILAGIRHAVNGHVKSARELKPFDEASPLARSHGTNYPIVQGPMTRVSDRASFVARVSENGGLPFFAFGLSRASDIKGQLEEIRQLLGDAPWGAGLLGFAPREVRNEQLELILTFRPPFALIAGGNPEQALNLEQKGVATYLHVPSPGLLKLFLEKGIRRFIFEGRECGGHIGPRSSFIIWNQMIDVLLESLPADALSQCHVLFAGGIHDALSSAMVATLAAPLAENGVRIGILMGTAYLFTEESVKSGAIIKGFQEEAIRCQNTTILESGPGHASRCAVTPYAETFNLEKQRISGDLESGEEIRNALERLNLGRLQIASKGIMRHARYGKDDLVPKYIEVAKKDQNLKGMYMIGQIAALRNRTLPMKELHQDIAVQGSRRLAEVEDVIMSPGEKKRKQRPSNIAIIGMACLMPKAPNLNVFWENILNKVDAITDVPEERWDSGIYYHPDPKERDKIYSSKGGFLDAVSFDPMRYGMPPNSLLSIEPLQLLSLETAYSALQDAGYADRPFERERTSVIFGVGGSIADLGQQYAFRSNIPFYFDNLSPEIMDRLPEWTEDTFPGILLNVTAGRIANRLDLGGTNFTVDAACASSLAAVYQAVNELENETSDMVIVGGADTAQSPFAYLCFSKTHALSPTGHCRTFDEKGDGTVISEGIAVIVLKRLADAERDGDRIYAVIKGVGASGDGRDKGLTAPRPEGQKRALDRAYRKAGFSPASVGLIEAHGTGTAAGDRAEIETLKQTVETKVPLQKNCALGSLKSMFGHTKCAAGVAGLIKAVLALHHKVLPPTMGITKPHPSIIDSPFYLNVEPRPWLQKTDGQPRRAGVSCFGFGGTNFHAVLEEYTDNFLSTVEDAVLNEWPSELLLFAGQSRQELIRDISALDQALKQGAQPQLFDLAFTLTGRSQKQSGLKLSIVTTSIEDLKTKLTRILETLSKSPKFETIQINDPTGIYYTEEPLSPAGRLAFLFPGQGSQYPGMFSDLAIQFREVREQFELADSVLADRYPRPLSKYIFVPSTFNKEDEQNCRKDLRQTNVAQPAIGAANMGSFKLLQALGVEPHFVGGHSYGEITALCAAGVFNEEVLYNLSETRGRFILEGAGQDLGTMAAVYATPERIGEGLQSIENVWIANFNSSKQTIISGTRKGVEEAIKHFKEKNIQATPINVSCAFHSPIMAPVKKRLVKFLGTINFAAPQVEVFSNTYGTPYPNGPETLGEYLGEHLTQPIEFVKEIEAMYDAGARIFIEVGPSKVLTGLVQQILSERLFLALPLNIRNRSDLFQLHHVLGNLFAHGVSVQLDRLYQGRERRELDLNALVEETRVRSLPPTTWMVDGGRAWPYQEPKAAFKSEPSHKTASPLTPKRGNTDKMDTSKDSFAIQKNSDAAVNLKTGPQKPYAGPPPSESELFPSGKLSANPLASLSTTTESEIDQVLLRHQQLMHRFLEVQHQVMLTYLNGEAAIPAPLRSDASDMAEVPKTFTAPSSVITEPDPEIVERVPPEKTEDLEETTVKMDREQIKTYVLKVVSERTGYPPEMLDLELDIEAELGIDSIKRVEILGTIQNAYFETAQGMGQEAMDELTGLKTLQAIIDWLDKFISTQSEDGKDDASVTQPAELVNPTSAVKDDEHDVATHRFLLEPVELSTSDKALQIPSDSVILIIDDKRGIGQILSDDLQRLGGCVALVGMGDHVDVKGENRYSANLIDPEAVRRLVELIRERQGAIGGVIHLLALKGEAAFKESNLKAWQDRLRLEAKSLFYLAKAVAQDLKKAAGSGVGWLIAATGMGGYFAADSDESTQFFPGHGAIVGLVKTVATEWPDVRCKAVDLDLKSPVATLANNLLNELTGSDREVEVGYQDSRRFVLRTAKSPMEMRNPVGLNINSNWVVVVTGGARGITAEVALEIARRYRPTLILAGRSPLPEGEERPDTIGLSSPQELKAALIDAMRQTKKQVTPIEVEAAYSQLCREREIRINLEGMQKIGVPLHYHQVDVCDEQAFSEFIDDIYANHGRLDLFIHGAGIIEDKLLEDKTSDSFDRVFDTKSKSGYILSRKLREESLKGLVLFSSIAGRFGNPGQCDYAATNEVVNKLAICLDRQWRGRVVAINWGPWAKTGMVSPEVKRKFRDSGVQLVPPSAGCQMLDNELRYGQKGQVEVIIGDGPWGIVEDRSSIAPCKKLPLLHDASLKFEKNGAFKVVRRLDPEIDQYLQDHRLDGTPVFPAAMAAELMAEVAQKGWPDWEVTRINDLKVLKGIVLKDGNHDIQITAQLRENHSAGDIQQEVEVNIHDLKPVRQLSYRAIVVMGKTTPSPTGNEPGLLTDLRSFEMTLDEAYDKWLFHGPSFRRIDEITGINDKGICAVLKPSNPAQTLRGPVNGQWLIDPLLLDSAFQLAILWERAHFNMTPLPSGFSAYHRYNSVPRFPVYCHLKAEPSVDGHILSTNMQFLDREYQPVAWLEEMAFSCSRELNRLSGCGHHLEE